MRGASALRRRVAIEQAMDTPDGAGGFSRSWAAQAHAWAAFQALRGGPHDRGDRPVLGNVFAVRMRWRDDLDGARRLRDGARIFVILHCGDPDGRRAWIDLTVEEETP